MPIERLALYDPAISVDGRLPSAFPPEFERLVAEGDLLGAMVVVGKGLENPGSSLPDPLIRASVRLLLKTPPGKTMARLLPTVPAESRLAVEADGPASAWASISSAVRFFVGERSPGYYRPSVEALAGVMPSADVEIVPRQGHDGIARAPKSLVASVTEFLSAGTA